MDRRFIGAGVALFLLGALIGWALSGSDEELQTELSAARNQEARLAALAQDVDAISGRLEEVATTTAARDYEARFGTLSEELAAVSGRLDEIAASVSGRIDEVATATTTRLDEINAAAGRFDQVAAGMGERLEAVALELARQHDALAQRTASLEQVQQEQSAALSAGIERIGSNLDGLGQRMAGELATPDPVAWDTLARQLKEMHATVSQIGGAGRRATGETEQQDDAGGGTPAGGDAGAGTTAPGTAGGDAEAGGSDGVDAGAGEQSGTDAAGGEAQSADANAGSAEQAGDAQAAAGGAAAAGAPGGGGTELRVGRTAGFEGGAVRVFLSAVMPETRTARVAVNGFTMTTLEMGAPATIESCELELTDVRQDSATLNVRCPASGQRQGGTSGQQNQETSGQQREGAVQAPRPQLVGTEGAPAEGSGTSAELAPGQTLVVGEGQLRLFVSAVDAERGQVRIAVNGTDVIPLAVGETHETNGCSVGLNGFEGRSAVLNYSC